MPILQFFDKLGYTLINVLRYLLEQIMYCFHDKLLDINADVIILLHWPFIRKQHFLKD